MDMLETVIGMVVYFLLTSLVATAIVEAFSNIRRSRGRVLREVIKTCVGGEFIVNKVYEHHLIRSLSQSDKTVNHQFHFPSYVPPESFSRAFLESTIGCNLGDAGDLRAIFAFEVPSVITTGQIDVNEMNAKPEVKEAYRKAYSILRPLVLAAKGNPMATLALIEDLFTKTNERAVGWYKTKVSISLLIVGFALAVATNGDAVRVFSRLNTNPALRAALIEYAKDGQLFTNINKDWGTASKSLSDTRITMLQANMMESIGGGWPEDPILFLNKEDNLFCIHWATKVFGFLLTAIAISLGAPFWFDVLNKLMKLRGSLKPSIGKKDGEQLDGTNQPVRGDNKIANTISAMDKQVPFANLQPSREHLVLVTELTRYARLAYQSKFVITETLKIPEYQNSKLKEFISEQRQFDVEVKDKILPFIVDTQVCIIESPSRIVVTFRGTEPSAWQDIVTDAVALLDIVYWYGTVSTGTVKAHKGFLNALDAVWGELLKQILTSKNLPIYFCGHSLGGALAVLAAARFLGDKELKKNERLDREKLFGGIYTIGQPKVGDVEFAKQTNSLFNGRYTRAVNHRDIVARVPPQISDSGYKHFGDLYYLDSHDSLWINPGWVTRLIDAGLSDNEVKALLKDSLADHSVEKYLQIFEKILAESTQSSVAFS